jgi:stage IV sporulation protein A
MSAVRQNGYGILAPKKEEIQMEEPEIMKQGSRYGVRIRASAPSVHMIKADIETEVAPIVGSEEQAQDLISYMKESGNALIFGKSVDEMVEEGIRTRLAAISGESQQKLQDAMKRIVNESNGRLICIIL